VDMSSMFEGAESFNHAVDDLDVRNVKSVDSMFKDAKEFNKSLKSWYLESIINEATKRP